MCLFKLDRELFEVLNDFNGQLWHFNIILSPSSLRKVKYFSTPGHRIFELVLSTDIIIN